MSVLDKWASMSLEWVVALSTHRQFGDPPQSEDSAGGLDKHADRRESCHERESLSTAG